MLRYWRSIFIQANKIALRWLFGNWRRRLIDAAVFIGAVAFLKYSGKESVMFDELTWMQAILTAAAIIYVPLVVINVFRVPYLSDREHQDEITRLKKLVGEHDAPPSFILSFETKEIDMEAVKPSLGDTKLFFKPQDICRIVVENTEARPISHCRVVLEGITPNCPVKNGALLLTDHRGADDEPTAFFDLAATETVY